MEPPPPDIFGDAALVAFASPTDLVGFEVDEFGQNAIVRLADGNVSTYNAQSLGSETNRDPTDCSMFHGVAILPGYTSYIQCDAGGAKTTLSIRSHTLGTPTFPAGQDPDFIPTDIPLSNFPDLTEADLERIGEILQYPFDYSRQETEGIDSIRIAWSLTLEDGRVATIAGGFYNNFPDSYSTAHGNFPFSSSGSVFPDMCRYVTEARTWVGYAYPGVQPQFFSPRFDEETNAGTDFDVTSYNREWIAPSTYNAATGIACHGDVAYFPVDGAAPYIAAFDLINATEIWRVATTEVEDAGIAVSRNGYMAHVDADEVFIRSSLDGTLLASLPRNASTFRGIAIDGTAQSVWVATSDNITRYEIYQATTESPVAPGTLGGSTFGGAAGGQGGVTDGVADPDRPGGNFLGDEIESASADIGISTSFLGILLGIVLVVATTAMFGALALVFTGNITLTLIAGAGGAVLSNIGAYIFSLYPAWVIAFEVFLALVITVLAFTLGARRG